MPRNEGPSLLCHLAGEIGAGYYINRLELSLGRLRLEVEILEGLADALGATRTLEPVLERLARFPLLVELTDDPYDRFVTAGGVTSGRS